MDSADTWAMYQVAELARRYSLRPSEALASVELVASAPMDREEYGKFVLHFYMDSPMADPEKDARFQKMMRSLGIPEGEYKLIADDAGEIEDAIDRAMALAPRSRIR